LKKISLINPYNNKKLFYRKNFLEDKSGNKFKIINKIPRILNGYYTSNFGFQWNKFRKTQIFHFDNNINEIRFFKQSQWKIKNLVKNNILEIGCGAGRFSSVVLNKTKANLYSIDSSNAVNACKLNNDKFIKNKRLKLFQSDIYNMPFPNNIFDKIFCFGVLQHTPNSFRAIDCMIEKVKKNGEVVIDFYPYKNILTKIHAKYFFRIFTKYISYEKLYQLINKNIDVVYFFYKILDKLGLHILTRFLPICDINNTIPKNISKKLLRKWIVLDTLDMFAPTYDKPIKISKMVDYIKTKNCKIIFSGDIKYLNMKAAVIKFKKK
jgi:ubiquinone/menaquinone biosynthesis C-methylase UbiE